MTIFARRINAAISDGAKQQIAALKQYPTLDTWRNPLTRGFTRKLVDEACRKTLSDIDFNYRMTDIDFNEIDCVLFETETTTADSPLLLYIHGGSFVAGSPTANAAAILPLCQISGCQALGVDYSLAPEARCPTQIDEIDAIYRSLLEEHRTVVLVSESTGSALALAALMRWRDEGMPLPAGAICLSPCVDGAGASDTQVTIDGHDPLIRSMGGKFVRGLFNFYAPDHDLKDPIVSPIYGDFKNLPPMMIHVGSREVLLGDAARLAEAMRQAGGNAQLRVFDGMYHRFHMHWMLEETRAAHEDLAAFIKSC